MENERRNFLKKAIWSAGFAGFLTGPMDMENQLKDGPPDPDPEFPCEEKYLWGDDSKNNGVNEDYRPRIKIYYPTVRGRDRENNKYPCILICPGGGYNVQAPHEGEPFARLFSLYGIVGVVLTYRVNPDRFPGSYSDACRAIRYLRSQSEKYAIDPDRIGIMGFSAGGHLASTVATQPELFYEEEDDLKDSISARPNRLILGYPVISFVDEFSHKGSMRSLLGDNPDQKLIMQLSNNHQVSSDTPPVFLFHTADDPGVPAQNSISFATACLYHNVPVALHLFPEGRHGVGMAVDNPKLRIWTEILIDWLQDWIVMK